MAIAQSPLLLIEEIADFLASCPTSEQLLAHHPSRQVQERAEELLDKSREGQLTPEEKRELDQYECAEMLMQLVKVKVRLHKSQVARP